jgi:hypothetical protein
MQKIHLHILCVHRTRSKTFNNELFPFIFIDSPMENSKKCIIFSTIESCKRLMQLQQDQSLERYKRRSDTPPSSLMDSTVSPKVKTTEGRVGAHSVALSTLKVEGHVGAPRWD